MKKRILSSIMALCLVMTLLPVTAFAADETPKDITETTTTLSAGSYILNKDVTLTSGALTVASDTTVTIDLKGHKLINKAGEHTIVNNGTLTIKDSSTDDVGTVDNVSHGKAAVYNNGTAIILGGKFTRSQEAGTSSGANGNSWYVLLNHGTMTIGQAGTENNIKVEANGSFSSLVENGYQNYNSGSENSGYVSGTNQPSPSLTINGGEFSGGINTIKNDDGAVLEINGGKFSNTAQAAVLNWNVATINDGEFSVTTNYAVVLNGRSTSATNINEEKINQGKLTITNGTFTTTGSVAIGTMNGASGDMGEVEISGGNYTVATNGTPIQKYGTNATVAVSGGTFSETIGSGYLADGYATTSTDGKVVVDKKTEAGDNDVAVVNGQYFTTLAGAIAAAKDGNTVTLLKNAETTPVIIRTGITLDLGTHTLTIKGTNTNQWYGLAFINGTNRITNGTIVDERGTNTDENCSYGWSAVLAQGPATMATDNVTIKTYHPVGNTVKDYNYIVSVTNGGGLTLNTNTVLEDTQGTSEDSKNDGYTAMGVRVLAGTNGNTKLTVNDAQINTDGFAISGNGISHGTEITINEGAVVTSSASTGIYHPQDGTLTITGGKITGTTGIEIRAGKLNMSGGTVTGTGSPTAVSPNGNGTTSDGAGIAVSQHTTMLPITVNITGGEINGYSAFYQVDTLKEMKDSNGKDRYTADQLSTAREKINLAIVDGTFKSTSPADNAQAVYSENFTKFISGGNYSDSVDPDYLDASLTAELYSRANTDAPYSYYTSVEEALKDAQSGDTVNNLASSDDSTDATYMVTLDYGYGNKTITVKTNTITLPTASRPGYRFLGWYVNGKTYPADQEVKITSDTTFTAQWHKNASPAPGYSVTTPTAANGTVTVSPSSAQKNATVTITVKPDAGYQLAGLTVTDADGNQLPLTKKSDTQYTFTMPASKVTVEATFEEIPQIHVCPAEKFTDVDTTQWYHEAIDYVIEAGMMNGVAADKFAPNSTTTRAMIVTILYRLEGSPAVSGSSVFTDVSDGTWYTDAVAWAAAKGVVNGTSATTFDPNDPITREQMAAILYRYASYKGYDVAEKANLSSYTDAGQISAYAADAMAWANAQGLITGVTKTTLEPQGNATRAQVATILMRFCENVVK